MRLTTSLLAPLLFLLLPLGQASAQEFSSLEERMSGSEFREAGLDKLSEEELATLNQWLRGQIGSVAAARASSAPSAAAGPADTRGLRSEPTFGSDGDIVSRIPGPFRGFSRSGQTIELENGQVWQTTENASFSVDLDSPTVTISPGFMSAWYMRVEGYNTRVRVRRIR